MSNKDKDNLPEGAKIRLKCNSLFKEFADKDFKASRDYSDEDIDRAIQLHEGDSLPGFQSSDAFYYLIHPLIEKLREPFQDCIADVYSCLETLTSDIIFKLCER